LACVALIHQRNNKALGLLLLLKEMN